MAVRLRFFELGSGFGSGEPLPPGVLESSSIIADDVLRPLRACSRNSMR